MRRVKPGRRHKYVSVLSVQALRPRYIQQGEGTTHRATWRMSKNNRKAHPRPGGVGYVLGTMRLPGRVGRCTPRVDDARTCARVPVWRKTSTGRSLAGRRNDRDASVCAQPVWPRPSSAVRVLARRFGRVRVLRRRRRRRRHVGRGGRGDCKQ